MSSKTLMMVTTSLLLAATIVIGAGLSFKTNNAIAQMMQPRMMTGNMTADGMMTTKLGGDMMMAGNKNITSSINLMNIIGQAIGSNVNVSLSDAATTAEGSVGNNSHAVAAHIDEQNGYLVYNVMVIDPSMNFSKVIVDPGNGQVLFSKQLSKEEHRMMHGMMGPGMMGPGMMGLGMMGPGMMGMGPGTMGPGTMGPGTMGPGTMGPGMMQ
ncbi:MAG: PepSY domain-containing protein [Nitrososphaeraceae archaeon]